MTIRSKGNKREMRMTERISFKEKEDNHGTVNKKVYYI